MTRPLLASPPTNKVALVIGATGATGRYVVETCLERSTWSKVICIGRRDFVPSEYNLNVGKENLKKLDNVVLKDIKEDVNKEEVRERFRGVDTVFNCIGTTRHAAGGPEGFVAIEAGISEAVTKVAREEVVNHFSVVTAQSAWVSVPALSWFHAFLYSNTLGRKQQCVIDAKFPHASIFRPGMLNRLDAVRGEEKAVMKFLSGLDTSKLARAMVDDAERVSRGSVDVPEKPFIFSGNKTILQQIQSSI